LCSTYLLLVIRNTTGMVHIKIGTVFPIRKTLHSINILIIYLMGCEAVPFGKNVLKEPNTFFFRFVLQPWRRRRDIYPKSCIYLFIWWVVKLCLSVKTFWRSRIHSSRDSYFNREEGGEVFLRNCDICLFIWWVVKLCLSVKTFWRSRIHSSSDSYFNREEGDEIFLRNRDIYSPTYTASHSRKPYSKC